jgi:hypothetical protein
MKKIIITIMLFTLCANAQNTLSKVQIIQLNRELEYIAYSWNGLPFETRVKIKSNFRRRYGKLDVSLLTNEVAKDFYNQIILK